MNKRSLVALALAGSLAVAPVIALPALAEDPVVTNDTVAAPTAGEATAPAAEKSQAVKDAEAAVATAQANYDAAKLAADAASDATNANVAAARTALDEAVVKWAQVQAQSANVVDNYDDARRDANNAAKALSEAEDAWKAAEEARIDATIALQKANDELGAFDEQADATQRAELNTEIDELTNSVPTLGQDASAKAADAERLSSELTALENQLQNDVADAQQAKDAADKALADAEKLVDDAIAESAAANKAAEDAEAAANEAYKTLVPLVTKHEAAAKAYKTTKDAYVQAKAEQDAATKNLTEINDRIADNEQQIPALETEIADKVEAIDELKKQEAQLQAELSQKQADLQAETDPDKQQQLQADIAALNKQLDNDPATGDANAPEGLKQQIQKAEAERQAMTQDRDQRQAQLSTDKANQPDAQTAAETAASDVQTKRDAWDDAYSALQAAEEERNAAQEDYEAKVAAMNETAWEAQEANYALDRANYVRGQKLLDKNTADQNLQKAQEALDEGLTPAQVGAIAQKKAEYEAAKKAADEALQKYEKAKQDLTEAVAELNTLPSKAKLEEAVADAKAALDAASENWVEKTQAVVDANAANEQAKAALDAAQKAYDEAEAAAVQALKNYVDARDALEALHKQHSDYADAQLKLANAANALANAKIALLEAELADVKANAPADLTDTVAQLEKELEEARTANGEKAEKIGQLEKQVSELKQQVEDLTPIEADTAILRAWREADGAEGVWGQKMSEEIPVAGWTNGAVTQYFQNGVAYWADDNAGVRYLGSGINSEWLRLGGVDGALGAPTGVETDLGDGVKVMTFDNGRIYYTPETGSRAIIGGILVRFLEGGGHEVYGAPATGEYTIGAGRVAQDFAKGVITWP